MSEATPTPRFTERPFPRFSFQRIFDDAESRHSRRPQLVTFAPIGVVSPASLQLMRRMSSASMPAASASSSRLLSIAQVTSGFP